MTTASDQSDLLRRHSVTAKAEVAQNAAIASSALRALAEDPHVALTARIIQRLAEMLERIDQLGAYRNEGDLAQFFDNTMVTREASEPIAVIAHAAARNQDSTIESTAPSSGGVDELIAGRGAIEIVDDKIVINDVKLAQEFSDSLMRLSETILAAACREDAERAPQYSVA